MAFTFHPVDQSRWGDFEQLFESKGAPGYCWCMVWREMLKGKSRSSRSDKKESIQHYVEHRGPIGLLGYDDGKPVAWCSVAPRDTHRSLGGDESKPNVWSVTCFFILRAHRDQGLMPQLLEEAGRYAHENGAEYLEAYPVSPDSHSYLFMGFVPAFERAGFSFVKMAGSRRHVMIKRLG